MVTVPCVRRVLSCAVVSLVAACSGGGSGDAPGPAGVAGNVGVGGSGGTAALGGGGGEEVPDVIHQIGGVEVSTLAGSEAAGDEDGAAASFNNPANLVRGPDGSLFVADFDNHRIRQLAATGSVTTLTHQEGFRRPFALTVLASGDLLVQTDWTVDGEANGQEGGVLWRIPTATGIAEPIAQDVGKPRGLATLADGRVVMSDVAHHDLRLFDPTTGAITALAGRAGEPGFADGDGQEARFDRPYGLVVTSDGDVLVADQLNHRIRKVTIDGMVTTFAGVGSPGMVDGALADARFDMPQDLALDLAGFVYVSDVGNHRVRRISPSGEVETVAGDGTAGFQDGSGAQTRFFGQEGIDVEPDGGVLFVADGSNGEPQPYHRIRQVMLP